MSDPAEPPPRPSTARVTAAPLAALRGLERPRAITVSFWCWVVAGLVGTGTVALETTRIDQMRSELARLTRASDPGTAQHTVDRVADLSVLLMIGTGAVLAVVGLLLAAAMRTGRNGARFALAPVALVGLGYAAFVVTATTGAMLGGLHTAVVAGLLGYASAILTGVITMFLRGTGPWFRRPREQ
jgi:hypothetical protein